MSALILQPVENTAMRCCLLIFTPEQMSSELAVLSLFFKTKKTPKPNSSVILFWG